MAGTRRAFTQAKADAYFAAYGEYARTLRAWLAAYGVGGPVLLITQKHAREMLLQAGETATVASWFLAGVTFQVGIAFVNKWMNWYLYAGEGDEAYGDDPIYKLVDRVSAHP